MKPTAALLLGLVLVPLTVNAQRQPPALQNVTISSVQDGDYYSLHVDFDYSGTGTCQCLVKTVQGRKKASFGTIKKCLDKFSMSVSPGRYEVEIKCKSGNNKQQVTVPEVNNCETLEDIDNGSVDMTGVTPGSTATYNCNQDYQLKGPATRTCLADGTWSGTEPTCIVSMEKMCKSMETLGEQMLSTSIGGRCTLSSDCIDMRCQIVRNLDPLPNAITIVQIHLHPCAKPPAISYKSTSPGRGTLIDGTFNKRRILSGVVGNATFEFTVGITQRPYGLSVKFKVKILGMTVHLTPPGVEGKIYMSCDCDCGHPGDIDHGTVDVSGGTMIGDTATYQCDQHFQLNGEDTRTCQDDGTWSGTAPTCEVPVESMCGSLMNMGTSLTTTSIGTVGECTVSSDCLSLRCLGLKLVVIPGVFVVDYNSFVTLLPCQTPYGMMLRSTTGNNTIVNGSFAHNTILSLYDPTRNLTTTLIAEVDQKPYGVTTSSTAYVLGNKIVFLPQTDVKMTCVCPTLPNITHGTVTRPDVATVGSTTQYQCEPTHVLKGPSIRTCQADGMWSGVEPTCDSTMETMCHSLRDVVNTFENQERVTSQCNMSEDCLTLDCSMAINATFVVLTANVKLTLLPCMKPYGIIAQTTSLLDNPINAVITETTSFVRDLGRLPVTVIFEVEQTDHGIDIGVSIQFPGNTLVLLPPTEVEMYCICPALEDNECMSVELSNGYEVGSHASYECNEPLEGNDQCSTRVCLPDGTWSGEEPTCEATQELMCKSLNMSIQAVRDEGADPALSANCTVSEDCLTVQCFANILFASYIITTTYNPCDTPYSFRLQVYQQNAEPLVNEVISESKVVSFTVTKVKGRIAVTVAQECSGITYSVIANFLGREVAFVPSTTVYLYCG